MDAAEVERNELANGSGSLYVECLIEQADRIKTMRTTVGHIKRALKFLETELHEAEFESRISNPNSRIYTFGIRDLESIFF